MNRVEACLKTQQFLMRYVKERGYFLNEGAAVGDEDEAALKVTSVTPRGESQCTAAFLCASALAPDQEPVRSWVTQCLEAAKQGVDRDVFELTGEVVPYTRAASKEGLAP
jgi:hypothetical protein